MPPSAARYDHWNNVVQCRKIPIQKAAQTTQIRPFATKANAPAAPSHPLKATQLCSRKSTHAPRKPFRSSATMTTATKPPGDFALPPSAANHNHNHKTVRWGKLPNQKAVQTTQIRPLTRKAKAPAAPGHPLQATNSYQQNVKSELQDIIASAKTKLNAKLHAWITELEQKSVANHARNMKRLDKRQDRLDEMMKINWKLHVKRMKRFQKISAQSSSHPPIDRAYDKSRAYQPSDRAADQATAYKLTDRGAQQSGSYQPINRVADKSGAYQPMDRASDQSSSYQLTDRVAQQSGSYQPIDRVADQSSSCPSTDRVSDKSSSCPPIDRVSDQSGSHPPIDRAADQSGSCQPTDRASAQSSSYPPTDRASDKSSSCPPIDRASHKSRSCYQPTDRVSDKSSSYPPTDRAADQSGSHQPTDRATDKSSSYPPIDRAADQSGLHPPIDRASDQSGSHPPIDRAPDKSSSHPPLRDHSPARIAKWIKEARPIVATSIKEAAEQIKRNFRSVADLFIRTSDCTLEDDTPAPQPRPPESQNLNEPPD